MPKPCHEEERSDSSNHVCVNRLYKLNVLHMVRKRSSGLLYVEMDVGAIDSVC